MKKDLTEIVFILDRSGSMSGLEADTIGGFNSMIEKQKKTEGEALISTVLFDNTSEVIHPICKYSFSSIVNINTESFGFNNFFAIFKRFCIIESHLL